MATADEYADWIVKNHARKGTPDFETVAQAYREAKAQESTVQQVGQYVTQTIPRAAGIAARTVGPYAAGAGAGALAGSVIPGVGTVIGGGAGLVAAAGTQLVDQLAGTDYTGKFMDKLGLPRAESPGERVAVDVGGALNVQGAVTSGGRLMAQSTAPVVKRIGEQLAASPALQTAASAGAGLGGGTVREGGGGPVAQFAGSVVSGLGTTALVGGAKAIYNAVAPKIGSRFTPNQDIAQINVTLNQILQQNGIDISQVPAQVRQQLAEEVRRATATGGQLNPDVVRRIADYAVVGATPTRGRVTRDPSQITQEKNLAKTGANTTDERLQELANIQNQNNQRMISFLNDQGAGGTQGPLAGQKGIDLITARNEAWKARERALHDAARDTAGRQIELDAQGFINEAYNALGRSGKGAFLPGEVKSLLAQLWKGSTTLPDGTEVAVPFNVDVMNNLKTTLATASRSATDGNVRAALAEVRTALENVRPRATGRPATGGTQVVDPAQMGAAQTQADAASAEAMAAFDKARRFSRAKHKWLESTPGIEAALENPNPDRFVQDFILSAGNKAQTAEVEKLVFNLRKDPEVMQAVKEHIATWLKQKALSGASDEVGNFSQSAYNRALNDIGDRKLRLFFTPGQISQLKTLGRVAAYEMVDPKGSAVNYSNSGAMITAKALAFLDKLASSGVLKGIPFGEAAVTGPARNVVNRVSANRALNVTPGMQQAPPRLVQGVEPSIIEKLFGPSVVLGSSAITKPGDDDR